MNTIDGRTLATKIRAEVKKEIQRLGIIPGLAVILVGHDPASHLYVSLKEKAAQAVDIHFEKYVFAGTEPPQDILSRIQELNARANIHGILVQVPLPREYDEDLVINQIDPEKDVDGFHQVNLRAILSGQPRIVPAVALAIAALIDETLHVTHPLSEAQAKSKGLRQAQALNGKKAILLVNRTEFAAPLEHLLEKRGALVQIILRPKDVTPDIAAQLQNADVLVVARGRPNFVTGNMLKDGAIVIDVGTNKLPDGKIVGDIDFESTLDKPGDITPVPGGVGPMTVVMLLKNTLELCKRSQNDSSAHQMARAPQRTKRRAN